MMTVQQYRGLDALPTPTDKGPKEGALLLVFGTTEHLQRHDVQQVLSAWARALVVVGASSDALISTAGLESLPVFTYLRFEQTRVRLASAPIPDPEASYEVGRQLGQVLAEPQLRYVLLLADGLHVNGSALTQGVEQAVGDVPITGGLANDGSRFQQTFVVAGERVLSRAAVAVGFYGERFRVGHGAVGGWKPFGPLMRVTKSDGSIVYTLDGQPALALYERYLGKDAAGLPATGLLFPLALYDDHQQPVGLIRTLLGIDRTRNALIFAGDVTGFYSNGEISPFNPTARCELHNQTMTITLWGEQ